MTPDERIRRADRAVALLADPLFAEAEAHIEAECWRLRSAVTDGKMAKAAIDEKRPRPAGY
jgi:hypothetical protein